MAKDSSFYDYVIEEVFREIEGITSRHMFGGWGIYQDGIFFALIANGELYFKVDSEIQKDFEKMGSKPFVYRGRKGKEIALTYWQLPADVLENSLELKLWIEKSIEAARKAKKK